MTIHMSKSELKWLRYLENRTGRINMLPEAITFDPTVSFSFCQVFWKLDINNFPRTPKLAQLKSGKTFKYAIEVGWEKMNC